MTDHDAIAARVRQGRKAGTPGPWKRGKNNPARVSREGRYIADFDPLHSKAQICENDAARAAFLPDLEDAYLDLYDEVRRLRAERDRFEAALGRACQVGGTTYLVERAEKAEAERDRLRAVLLKIAEYLPSFDYVARDEFGRCTDLPGSPYDRGKADASAHLSAIARAALKGTSK